MTAWVVGFVLLFLTPVFEKLPYCTLGAIVCSSVTGLLEYEQAIYLWKVGKAGGGGEDGTGAGVRKSCRRPDTARRALVPCACPLLRPCDSPCVRVLRCPRTLQVNKLDFLVWMASFLGTLFISIEIGLGIAIGLAMLIGKLRQCVTSCSWPAFGYVKGPFAQPRHNYRNT